MADVKSVLIALADKMAEHLGEGRKVYLEGIGYFQVNLHCKEEVRTIHAVRSENVELKSVSFRADTNLKKSLKKEKIQRSKNKPQSKPMTEKEIDVIITLGDGEACATAYGCDLTYDYVKINGDYRT